MYLPYIFIRRSTLVQIFWTIMDNTYNLEHAFKSFSCGSASLKSCIISRCKELHRRHVTQAPGVVCSNVATYSTDPMSDSWPAVLTATHRGFCSVNTVTEVLLSIFLPLHRIFLQTSINMRFQITDTKSWRNIRKCLRSLTCTHLGFVSPCIFIHSNELIPTRCSN
jgi:hypothetical protein